MGKILKFTKGANEKGFQGKVEHNLHTLEEKAEVLTILLWIMGKS